MAKPKSKTNDKGAIPAAPGKVFDGPVVGMPEGLTVTRRVTMPSLALKTPGQGRALLIQDAMRISQIKDKTDQKREPATICTVTDMKSGEMFTFIVPAVVRENLVRDYPSDSYVGKGFWIVNKGKRTETQRYNDFEITEVTVKAEHHAFPIPQKS